MQITATHRVLRRTAGRTVLAESTNIRGNSAAGGVAGETVKFGSLQFGGQDSKQIRLQQMKEQLELLRLNYKQLQDRLPRHEAVDHSLTVWKVRGLTKQLAAAKAREQELAAQNCSLKQEYARLELQQSSLPSLKARAGEQSLLIEQLMDQLERSEQTLFELRLLLHNNTGRDEPQLRQMALAQAAAIQSLE